MALKISKGIDGIPTETIPDDPAQFVNWFKSVGISRWLANADVRNAESGTGISITGNISSPAKVSVSTDLQSLFAQPYVLAGAPVAPAIMTDYRSIAVQSGVVSLTDGGALSTIKIGIEANGIGNTQLRQGTAASIIGNETNAIANVADIAASADGQVLTRASGALAFALLGANPTGTIGLTAVNGTATTFPRSDGAPALSQAIAPTWTGAHTFAPAAGTPVAITSPVQNAIAITGAAGLNSQVVNSAVANFSAYFKANVLTYAGAVFGVNDTGSLDANGIPAGGWGVGTPNGINFNIGIGGATKVTVASTTGATSLTGPLGVNGAAPPAQVTGWGTPTGASVVTNFPGAGPATLAQCSNAIAELITILKSYGLIGA